jgi:putative salt-induced outer membrane protein
MLRTARVLLFATALVLAAGKAAAQQTPGWTGLTSLGFQATSGNTETTNLNTKLQLGYDFERWHYSGRASAVAASQDKQATAEAYTVGGKAQWDVYDGTYTFGRVDWNKDRFSGYDHQISETFGIGQRFLDTMRQTLSGEVGVGARQSRLRSGDSESEVVVRGQGDYIFRFSENARFEQTLAVESGSSNTYLQSDSAVKANVVQNIALVASYTIKSNTHVPAGSEKTDTFTAVSLEYTF